MSSAAWEGAWATGCTHRWWGIDAAQRYKAVQHRQWDEAAPALRRWWPAFERVMQPVTAAMVARAHLSTGAHVVDVASGFGEPALAIARHLAPTGRVVVTDLSAAMLAVAAERASTLGVGNVACVQMDAEAPVLASRRYDAVVCRLGLMFLPRLHVALQRPKILLRPGGRFDAAVWGPPERNIWLTVALGILAESLPLPPPAPEGVGPFSLSAPGHLGSALSDSGFVGVHEEQVPVEFAWASPARYAAFHAASPLGRLVTDHEAERREQAWADVAFAAEQRWGGEALTVPGELVVAAAPARSGTVGPGAPWGTYSPRPRSQGGEPTRKLRWRQRPVTLRSHPRDSAGTFGDRMPERCGSRPERWPRSAVSERDGNRVISRRPEAPAQS